MKKISEVNFPFRAFTPPPDCEEIHISAMIDKTIIFESVDLTTDDMGDFFVAVVKDGDKKYSFAVSHTVLFKKLMYLKDNGLLPIEATLRKTRYYDLE